MGKKINYTEKFKKDMFNSVGYEFELVDELSSETHKEITIRHVICNNEFKVKPKEFLLNKECLACKEIIQKFKEDNKVELRKLKAEQRKLKAEERKLKIQEPKDHFKSMIESQNKKTVQKYFGRAYKYVSLKNGKMTIEHKRCGCEFKVNSNAIYGKSCPNCF